MKTNTFFTLLLAFTTLIQLPALAMHKHERKKNKQKLLAILTAGTKLCIGDVEIREEHDSNSPLSPKGKNLNKKINLKEPSSSISKKEKLERNLNKCKRRSLSDDIEIFEEIQEEIDDEMEALDKALSEKETFERKNQLKEEHKEIYSKSEPKETAFNFEEENNDKSGYDSE